MSRKRAAVDLLSAVVVQVIAIAFLHAYSKIATLRLIFEGRHIQFAAGHEALLNISYVALAVPLVARSQII